MENIMKREIIRVEPLTTWLDNYKAPTSTVTKHGDTIYVTGAPPFDPETGEIFRGNIERQTELVLEQMKLCVETAGSSLDNVLKVNVYVTSVDMFPAVNEVYRRFFPKDPPARIFINVPAWNGGFDIEVHPKPDQWEAYLANAKMLRPELERIDGFVDNIRYKSLTREGWILSLSGWRDEKSVVRWRTKMRHHMVQEKGRSEILLDYHLRVGQITRDSRVPEGCVLTEQRLDET